jgi:aryl-alcohol dehydrogenase (NADP+)
MSYGDPARGARQWSLSEEDSLPFFRQALDAGINFFDTANSYSAGGSEEITGRALLGLTGRDNVVIATKVFFPLREGPNAGGLSRVAIMREIDASLKRLGTDYVDLYQIHRLDPDVAMEETLEALHDVVKAGKARYIGASSMYAWQFASMLHIAEVHGWTRFVSMQNHYNLIYREEEREMIPLCRDRGIGVIPWSPLARGRLTRPWNDETTRSGLDRAGQVLYVDGDATIVDAVGEVAERRGVSRAQIALAWLLGRPGVHAPIVGATKQEHLTDAINAVDLELDEKETDALEAPYRPHAVSGHV